MQSQLSIMNLTTDIGQNSVERILFQSSRLYVLHVMQNQSIPQLKCGTITKLNCIRAAFDLPMI